MTMYIRTLAKTETEFRFELMKKDGSKEFLLVRIDGDEIRQFKKRYIADYLDWISEHEGSTTWADLDVLISQIMNAPVHIL